jgi:glycosyltransferase involved in cell wall biosynthesis
MRIGILSPVSIMYFKKYFDDVNARKVVDENSMDVLTTSVNTLVQSFINEGHFVRIFTLAPNTFHIKGNGIEIIGVKKYNKYPIKYLWGVFLDSNRLKLNMNSYLKDLDVLHAHWTYSYALAASSFTEIIPVFCTVRDWAAYIWKIESFKNKVTWTFRVLINELVFRNKKINFISNSPYTADKVKKKYGIDSPILPNPIIESFLKFDETSKPLNLELLCVSSSNDKRKNILALLKVFKRLLKNYPDAPLTLVGTPFLKQNEIIKHWDSKELLERVTLVGFSNHDDLKNYFDNALIFVAPSLEETFGNTLLESLARKTLIVAGKYSGAVPYVLEQGTSGFLCDMTDLDDMYDTIEYAYKNKEEALEKVRNGFQLLLNNYLDNKLSKKHLDLYNKRLIKI